MREEGEWGGLRPERADRELRVIPRNPLTRRRRPVQQRLLRGQGLRRSAPLGGPRGGQHGPPCGPSAKRPRAPAGRHDAPMAPMASTLKMEGA
jgi:hypothetical protein